MSIPKKLTVFENIYRNNTEEPILKLEDHGVIALADSRPRLPLQVVVASSEGFREGESNSFDIDPSIRRKIFEVASAIGLKIGELCGEKENPIWTITGFQIKNHPHVVLAKGQSGDLTVLENGPQLGPEAVHNTLEMIKFTPIEVANLEASLDKL